ILNITRFFVTREPSSTKFYPLSLHDALPIFLRRRRDPERCDPLVSHAPCGAGRSAPAGERDAGGRAGRGCAIRLARRRRGAGERSEEHTSELQSRRDLVCRLLLEKKKYTSHM